MIASFSHHYIFLKTRKTASTSVELALSMSCKDDDICTPVWPEDEYLRSEQGCGPMNYLNQQGGLFYNHMSARETRHYLPQFWDTAFKFTIERNPYEKVISRAYWEIGRRNGDPSKDLDDEIDRAIEQQSYLNYPIYTIDDRVAVNRIVRYENLTVELSGIAKALEIPLPDSLPRAKSRFRANRRPAVEILTPTQKKRILRDASYEFSLMKYES